MPANLTLFTDSFAIQKFIISYKVGYVVIFRSNSVVTGLFVSDSISMWVVGVKKRVLYYFPGPVCHNISVLNHGISIMNFFMARVLIMALYRHFMVKFIVKF